MSINRSYAPAVILLFLTLLSSFVLSSSIASADDSVVDDVSITVPTSCTMRGTGMNSHNATINNGTYNSEVGTTTLKAFCNDNEGFAIYAIGYTNNTDGNTVLASQTLGSNFDIATGTQTSGNSQWAMKLATDSNATYPIELQNGFGSFHTVPDDYTLVAKRTAGTDIDTGESATGSTLTTTYQVYISNTQSADTYTGKVKYVMVHPNTAPEPVREDQVAIIFDGNGLTFSGGATTNRVVYGESCEAIDYGWVGNTPTISKTSNIANDGTMNTYNASNVSVEDTVTFAGADRLRVELTYGYDYNGGMYVFTGIPEEHEDIEDYEEDETFYDYFWSEDWENNGEKTTEIELVLDTDTVTFMTTRWGEPTVNYYGYHAEIYPIYSEETAGASYQVFYEECGIAIESGTYAETTTWNGYWETTIDGYHWSFDDEDDIKRYIEENKELLGGSTMTLYAYYPYTIVYNGNNSTAGTMDDFSSELDNFYYNNINLFAPNYYKTGYGFAGWSTDPNATVNSSSEIYGPSETITSDEFIVDENVHTINLYAVWVPTNGVMQSFSCSSLSAGEVTALSDSRDSNVYTVGKMQDGKCWMMENLRLDAENSLDSTKAQGYGGSFVGLANSEDSGFLYNSTTANSLYNTSNITGNNQGLRFPRYNNNHIKIGGTNAAGVPLIPKPTDREMDYSQPVQWYSYGNYYTWAAAIADTSDYTTTTNITTSICPSGWHLPTSSESNTLVSSFSGVNPQDPRDENLLRAYTSYPNNFIYSGYYTQNRAQQYGDDLGEYWLATNNTYNSAYRIYLQKGPFALPSSDNGSKFQGLPIRCVAD